MFRVVVAFMALVGCQARFPLDPGSKPEAPPGQMVVGAHTTRGLTSANDHQLLITDADGALVETLGAAGHDWVFVPERGAVTQVFRTDRGQAYIDVRSSLEDGDLLFFRGARADDVTEIQKASVLVPPSDGEPVTVTTSCSNERFRDFDVYTEDGVVEQRIVYVPITEACPPGDAFDVVAWTDDGRVTWASEPMPRNRAEPIEVTLDPFRPQAGCVRVEYLGDEDDIVPSGVGLRDLVVRGDRTSGARCLEVVPGFHNAIQATISRPGLGTFTASTLVHQRSDAIAEDGQTRTIEFAAGEMPPEADGWSMDASGTFDVPLPEGWVCDGGRLANHLRLRHHSEEANVMWFGDYRERVVFPELGPPWDEIIGSTSYMEVRVMSVEGGYRGQVSSQHIRVGAFAMLQLLPAGERICDSHQTLWR